jgi:ATP-dependent Clp protease ATP-binding subunit ClpA
MIVTRSAQSSRRHGRALGASVLKAVILFLGLQASRAQGASPISDRFTAAQGIAEVGMSERVDEQPDPRLSGILRDRLSQQAVRVLYYARLELSLHPRRSIEPEHVLLGILRVEPTAVSTYLAGDWTIERVETALKLPAAGANAMPEHVEIPFSPAVMAALRRAVLTADELESSPIQPGHLLAALLEDESLAVVKLLRQAGITRALVLDFVKSRGGADSGDR